eukprot:561459-Hanusia_phi.AAC.1
MPADVTSTSLVDSGSASCSESGVTAAEQSSSPSRDPPVLTAARRAVTSSARSVSFRLRVPAGIRSGGRDID